MGNPGFWIFFIFMDYKILGPKWDLMRELSKLIPG